MSDREKLVELLEELEALPCCYTYQGQADHLISNGVTVQKWIPVSERLPVHGVVILCYTKYQEVGVFQWDSAAEKWLTNTWDYSKDSITHWMPLPELPKECE